MNVVAVSFKCDHCIITGHNLTVKDHPLYLPLICIIMCLLGTEYGVLQKRACFSEEHIGDCLRGLKAVGSFVVTPLLCRYVGVNFFHLTESVK
jgi:hypothetical protein